MAKNFLYVDSAGEYVESQGAYEQADFISTSAGAGDAGKPIVLDAAGHIDATMINDADIDHGNLTGKGDDDHTQYILVDGTRAFSGDQSLGGNLLTNVGANAASITNDLHAANKAYVDSVAQGLAIHEPVRAASTADLTVTYDNGTAGVGATLTNADTQAALVVDGVTMVVSDRVLIKDEIDAIDEVSTVQTLAQASITENDFFWLFTRDTAHYFWFEKGTGADPTPASPYGDPSTTSGHIVDISGATTADDVALILQGVVDGLSDFGASVVTDTVTVTNATSDEVRDLEDGTAGTGFTLAVTTQGKSIGYTNGIYDVTDIGSGSTNWILTRSTDFDHDPTAEIHDGDFFFVQEGTVNGQNGYVQSHGWVASGYNGTVGETQILFQQFSGAGQITAGDGMTKTGNTLDVGAGDGINVNADTVEVDVTDIIDLNYGLVEDTNNIRVNLESDGAIAFDATNKGLEVQVDDATIEIATNALQVKADGIDDTHIDWGTGAGQVNAEDVPVIDSGANFTATDVEGVLLEIYNTIPGAQNVFTEMNAPNGTNPVADNSTDTLNFTATGGEIVITGNASTDTLNFDIGTDTINDTHVDWGTGANQVNAEDMPVIDAGTNFTATEVEGVLLELYNAITAEDDIQLTVGSGGVTKGDLLYVSANDTVNKVVIANGEYAIGIAATTESAAASVGVVRDDKIIAAVLTGATAGDRYYWTGSAWSTTIPTGSGNRVWFGGVAVNATDLYVQVDYIKKNK